MQVARFRGWLDLDLLAREAVEASIAYNKALIACEDNAMGEAVIRDIDRLGGRQVWRWMIDPAGQKQKRLGWKTTDRTKVRAFKNLKAAVRDETIKINDHETFHELRGVTFAAEPGTRNEGRIETQPDRHDDLAISLAIGVDILTGLERENLVNPRAEIHEDKGQGQERSARRSREKAPNSWAVGAGSERWGRGEG